MMVAPTVARLVALSSVVALLAMPCRAQQREIASAVAAERARAASIGLPEETSKPLLALLGCSEAAAKANRPLLGVYFLQTPYMELNGRQFMSDRAKAIGADKAAYEREWLAVGRTIKAKERELVARPARHLPSAITALAQVARAQAGPYYQSGRQYGLETSLEYGLYYMGFATADYDFARLCGTFPFASAGAAPRYASVKPDLDRLETEIVSAYEKADADGRRRFLDLNANLKLASELEGRGWFEGALQKYLDITMRLQLVVGPNPGGREAELRGALDAARKRLSSAPTDQSIALLYVEMAENALDSPCSVDANPVGRAAAIVDRVLPSYFAYLERTRR